MKKLITAFTFAIGAIALAAQSPFQFNFQAVARDLAGNPLQNQAVDFRLSILQGSLGGTAVYVEEMSASTNNFGLANLLVGSGTPSLGSLDTMDWAAGPYFLQIELDIQNGDGYQLMGTSAMTSVPYALHALTTEQPGPEGPQGEIGPQGEQGLPGIDGLDAVVDSVYLDSLVQSHISNNGIGGGCDFSFPEGYSGDGITLKLFTPYTVPADKRLYITQVFSWQSTLEIDGNLICYGGNLPNSTGRSLTLGSTIVVNAGQIVSASSSNTRISGLLVTPTDALEGVTLAVGVDPGSQFIVPEGKKLYITSVQSYSSTLKIDDIQIVSMSNYSHNASDPFSLGNPIVVNSGQILAALANQVEDIVVVNGYLVDEDYFANCASASASFTTGSAIDSATVANMISAALPTPAAQIGEFRDGGVVFWVDGTGQHGLICDINDLPQAQWGCSNTSIDGADGTSIASGAQNTSHILAGCPTVGIAAYNCDNSSAQGYTDWYLPSADEMYEIFINSAQIGFTSITNGGTGLVITEDWDYYWTSTEVDAGNAFVQEMTGAGNNLVRPKNYAGWRVRAIRVF